MKKVRFLVPVPDKGKHLSRDAKEYSAKVIDAYVCSCDAGPVIVSRGIGTGRAKKWYVRDIDTGYLLSSGSYRTRKEAEKAAPEWAEKVAAWKRDNEELTDALSRVRSELKLAHKAIYPNQWREGIIV